MSESIKLRLVYAIAFVLMASIIGFSFKNRNEGLDAITVVGLGSQDFKSDEILWSARFTTRSFDIKEAYNKIVYDQKVVALFFEKKGFNSNEFTFGPVNFHKNFREVRIEDSNNQYNTKYEQVFDGYEAFQEIIFTAKNNVELMNKIEKVSSKTAELINSGIELTSNPMQYTYSKLPALKHVLIQKATQDAKDRAVKIVTNAGGDLGKLKKATMGVFQITGKGSTEEDSYGGINDTFHKFKTARITVRLEYQLD